LCRKCDIDIIFKTMRKYLSTLLVASVLAASCTKDAEVIREKIVSQSRPILSGQGQPENTKGEDGDYYLDLANANLYGPKTKGAWGAPALNLKGVAGKDGKDGANGTNGATPRIEDNGNWWVGNTDLGVKAQGTQGQKGQDGATPRIGDNGNWWVGNTDLGVKAQGAQGQKGQDGATPRIGDNGNWWVGNTDLGVKAQGTQGQKGQDGATPRIGDNGNWWVGNTDLGVKAQGAQGQKGQDGRNGQDGRDGQNGRDGAIPSIGDNGNWWVGNQDTGKPARGAQGQKGQDGAIPSIGDNGNWWVGDQDTGKPARGEQGERGVAGQNGTDGSKILAEDRAPQATDGVKGDYFIDKVAKIFYGPKTETGWPTSGIYLGTNQILTADYQLSEDGKTLVKWLNPKTRFIDMNADPKLKEVTKIGNVAFDKQANGINYQLTTIIVGDKVTEIGNSAFRTCDRLKSVELPEGITRIENGTFEGCVRLQIIEIPESVTSIGDGAFSTCVKLSSVILPERVNSLGNAAFGNCASLHSIIIRNKTPFAIANSVFTQTPIQNIYVFSEKVDDYKNVVAGPYKNKIKALDFPGDN